MGETLTLEIPGEGSQPAASRQQQSATHEPNATLTEELTQQPSQPSATTADDTAIRESRAAIERLQGERDAARAAEGRAASEANRQRTEASRLRDEAARANQGRAADRRAALASTVQAADAELARAKDAVRTAGEAGDYTAMAEAQELIASARYRKDSASAELASLGDPTADNRQPQPQRQAEPQPDHVPGPRARKWLDAHPEMQSNEDFRDAAILGHRQAIKKGYAPETDEYFAHIDRTVAGFKPQPQQQQQQPHAQQEPSPMPEQQPRGSTSQAGPSNRGGGSLPSGWKTVNTAAGPINVQDLPGGGMKFNLADPSTAENIDDFAKVNYPGEYQKDPKGAKAMFAREMVRIAREAASGGVHDLVTGDGATYR